MTYNIESIIKSPFVQKDWLKRILPFFILIFVISFGSSFLNLSDSLTTAFEGSDARQAVNAGISIFSAAIGGFIFLLSLIQTFYFEGYFLKATKNVMQNDEANFLPDHSNIQETVILSLKYFAVNFFLSIIPFIVSIPLWIGGIISVFYLIESNAMDYMGSDLPIELILIITGVYFIVFIILTIVYYALFGQTTKYLFIKTENIWESIKVSKNIKLAKENLSEIFIAFGYSFLLGLMLGIVSIFTFCISFITTPISQVLRTTWLANINGTLFRNIKD